MNWFLSFQGSGGEKSLSLIVFITSSQSYQFFKSFFNYLLIIKLLFRSVILVYLVVIECID